MAWTIGPRTTGTIGGKRDSVCYQCSPAASSGLAVARTGKTRLAIGCLYFLHRFCSLLHW